MSKTYIDCLRQLTKKDIFNGLLGYGMFDTKLIPVFTSENFYNYCEKNPSFAYKKEGYDWIRYLNNRNDGNYRAMGIPVPFPYYKLCKLLSDEWDNLLDYFEKVTKFNRYKISRIHVKKMKHSPQIFEMNYKSLEKGDFDRGDIVNEKYVVKADISSCFPSIYTHAISWAIHGKEIAKKRKSDPKLLGNEIDSCVSLTTYNETHGILIGPTTSNIISEIILCKIDEALSKKGYRFTRHIDDYACYVDSIEKGEYFISDLSKALTAYDLSLNVKKTSIVKIDLATDYNLSYKIHQYDYLLEYNSKFNLITYPQINTYFDALQRIYVESGYNLSVYSFAIKLLSKKDFSINARVWLIEKMCSLSSAQPYLLPFMEKYVFNEHGITNDFNLYAEGLYNEGISSGNYSKSYYSLYFCILNVSKYASISDAVIVNNLKNIDSCIFKIISWQYLNKFYPGLYDKDIYNHAKDLKDVDFERNWLFVYEVLSQVDLKDSWAQLKKNGVTFLDKKALNGGVHWKTIMNSNI